MEQFPKISIITVVFNAVDTLEDTIRSVLAQTYKNIEYIIIDGGSSDGTIDIIKKYEHNISNWISEPDNGIYDAMNKGVFMATGEWVIFLGADDILNNIIHKIVEEFLDKCTIYYGNVYMTSSNLIYSGRFNKYKLAYKNICHQSIFYPMVVFKHYVFDLSYETHADYDLNLKCFVDKRFDFKYLNVIVSQYNETGFSTRNEDLFYSKRRFEMLRELYPFTVYCYARLRYLARKYLKPKVK